MHVGQGRFFAIQDDSVEMNAKDAGRAGANINSAIGDRGSTLEVDQLARHRQLPERHAAGQFQTMKHRPIRLMHAVPEDQLIINNGRRAHGWQFQIGCSLTPGDALSRFGIRRERVECRGIESA